MPAFEFATESFQKVAAELADILQQFVEDRMVGPGILDQFRLPPLVTKIPKMPSWEQNQAADALMLWVVWPAQTPAPAAEKHSSFADRRGLIS
jgi:hypothetical protein